MDNSNDSFTDPVMEREAVETLLSISKAPSPQRIETVMDKIPSETDPCSLPGDPPPLVAPYSQMSVSEHSKQPHFPRSPNEVLAMARQMCDEIENRSLSASPVDHSRLGLCPTVEGRRLMSMEENRTLSQLRVNASNGPKKTFPGTSKLAQVYLLILNLLSSFASDMVNVEVCVKL